MIIKYLECYEIIIFIPLESNLSHPPLEIHRFQEIL